MRIRDWSSDVCSSDLPDLPLPCTSLNAAKANGRGTAWNWPGILWEQPGKAESFAAKTMETENVTRTNFMSEFCFANETCRIWAFSGDFPSNPKLSPLFPSGPLKDFAFIGADRYEETTAEIQSLLANL